MNGDFKARDWVTRYALGEGPSSLVHLAAREQLGNDGATEVEDRIAAMSESAGLIRLFSG